MKVLFLSSRAHLALDPAEKAQFSGGAELQVALLARELARRGHGVTIVGSDEGQAASRSLDGVRLLVGGPYHTGRLLDTLRSLPRVLGAIRRERPDIVAVMGWTAWLFILLLARPWLRFSLVFICSSDVEVDGRYRRAHPLRGALFERGMRGADARFAMTSDQAALFERAGLSCSLYRNLVPPRGAAALPSKDIGFLWISRCQRLKRPHLFLDLAAAHPGERAVMIAPPEDSALYAELEARAAGMPSVQLIPGVPYHEAQSWYDRAQLFVNTSEFEGYPNSFVQAGLGRAAIVSLLVDPDRVLTQHGAGFCAGGDMPRLIAESGAILRDSERRRSLQEAAARLVAERHCPEENVSAFLAGLPAASQRGAAS